MTWWRAYRDRCLRRLHEAVRDIAREEARLVEQRLEAQQRDTDSKDWFAEQRAKRDAARDLSDPRKLLLQQLNVIGYDYKGRDERFGLGAVALVAYINDAEITERWRALGLGEAAIRAR